MTAHAIKAVTKHASPDGWPRSRMLCISVVAVTLLVGALAGPALALSLADIPTDQLPDWYFDANPDDVAFAYYDLRLTPGLEGQYTDLEKGSNSLFRESVSGISELDPNDEWSWVEGTGWTINIDGDPSVTFHWGNARQDRWIKRFRQSFIFRGGIPDTDNITIRTDSDNDHIKKVNVGWSPTTGNLILDYDIWPQPNDVWVTVPFRTLSPAVVEQGWVLDQCTPIPEPLTAIGVLLASMGGAAALRSRRTS